MVTTTSSGFSTYRTHQISIRDEKAGVFSNSRDDDLENLEVDYDNNVTDLYQFISNLQWEEALLTIRKNPIEARTWVVRYHEDEDKGMMWRFLPIHSAAARQPPEAIIVALIEAYPEGVESCDDQGKYALHYAAGNQASSGVIRALLDAYPKAATISDPEGKLPLHWMAISGPFEPSAVEALVYATHRLSTIVDDEGWSPLDYVKESDYPYKQDMIAILQNRSPPKQALSRIYVPSVSSNLSSPTFGMDSQRGLGLSEFLRRSSKVSPTDGNGHAVHSSNQSVKSVNTSMTKSSTNKTVARLNAQIAKMKAEAAFTEAEYEERLANQREEHDEAVKALQESIHQTIEKHNRTKQDLASKENFIAYKEGMIASRENELAHYNLQNSRLSEDLAQLNGILREDKNILGEYKIKIVSLQNKLKEMVDEQLNISKSLEAIEDDAKKASESRRQKLQALVDEEVQEARELSRLKRVHGNMFGSPTVMEALIQQKNIMKNFEAVLEDCNSQYEDIDLSASL
mmetsp:Transcript_12803/g.24026  ORF Transcript_12803/g.24026 Transcript_12803/m.24026 type:complete len:515 (+) Transcript_12803:166-1710(+)